MSLQGSSVGLPSTEDTTAEGTGLAHAYDRASQHPNCVERVTVDLPPDSFQQLAGAVRAFVVARRADGAPPERVLATIKSVVRRSSILGADEACGDRLRALILREFLASYYAARAPVPASIE